MKEREMCGACSTRVTRNIYTWLWWEELKERSGWEGLGIGGKILLSGS
jgi:hypothetical protein